MQRGARGVLVLSNFEEGKANFRIYNSDAFRRSITNFLRDKKIELGQEESSILLSAIIRVEATTIAVTKKRDIGIKK